MTDQVGCNSREIGDLAGLSGTGSLMKTLYWFQWWLELYLLYDAIRMREIIVWLYFKLLNSSGKSFHRNAAEFPHL